MSLSPAARSFGKELLDSGQEPLDTKEIHLQSQERQTLRFIVRKSVVCCFHSTPYPSWDDSLLPLPIPEGHRCLADHLYVILYI